MVALGQVSMMDSSIRNLSAISHYILLLVYHVICFFQLIVIM